MEEIKYCVYVHTNKFNGKKYVGVTSKKPEDRWKNGRGYRNNKYFTRAIKKYGWDEGFTHEIIAEGLSVEDAYKMERDLIAEYDCINPNGYNATSGGEIGKEYSEETRKKISKANKNPSEETREKMSKSAKARCTDEWRKVASDRMKGKRTGENNPNFRNGTRCNAFNKKNATNTEKCSKDTTNPASYNWSGNNNPRHLSPLIGKDNPRARPIVQLTKDGEFIRKWDYITEAANFLNVKPWNIITCCTHPEKLKSAYGFKWMYLEDYEKLTQQNDLENNK